MSLIKSELLSSIKGIVHGFSDKSLNGNAEKITRILDLDDINLLKQVHGERVVVVSEITALREREEADAQITALPGIGIGIATADCVPILLASEDGSFIAAVHAGWRGTLNEIAVNAVRKFSEIYGIEPKHLKAAIGPCIESCCYEVGEEVAAEFLNRFENTNDYLFDTENGKYKLDLALLNERLLLSEGVAEIEAIGICTMCSPDFYSYRGDGKGTGRQLSVIGISGPG